MLGRGGPTIRCGSNSGYGPIDSLSNRLDFTRERRSRVSDFTSSLARNASNTTNQTSWGGWSGLSTMLLFVEQTPLYNAINFSVPCLHSAGVGSEGNTTAVLTKINSLLCPSSLPYSGTTTPVAGGVSGPSPGTNSQYPNCLYSFGGGDTDDDFGNVGLSSYHPGGANVAFCDGSVHFLKNTTNQMTIWSLGSRAQGEVISADAY